VTIKNSIIWNDVTIKSGCSLEDNLVCTGVVLGEDVVVKAGAMIDHRVQIKPKAVIDKNTICSTYAIITNDKG